LNEFVERGRESGPRALDLTTNAPLKARSDDAKLRRAFQRRDKARDGIGCQSQVRVHDEEMCVAWRDRGTPVRGGAVADVPGAEHRDACVESSKLLGLNGRVRHNYHFPDETALRDDAPDRSF
jgi:hypothetical protein